MIWRACERLRLSLSDYGKKSHWEKASIIAYEQIRQLEDSEDLANLHGAK